MAKMYPNNLNAFNPTISEQKVFDALRNQLPEDYSVFYSVSWSEGQNGIIKSNSEIDFIIIDPRNGFICVEVKGGKGVNIKDGEWYLQEGDNTERKLNKSPYEQVEKSMYYFKNYYQRQYNFPFQGVYGSIVIFPMFNIERKEFISNRSPEMTLDYNDMQDLRQKVDDAFRFWRRNNSYPKLTSIQHENLLNLIKKRIAMSAAGGALISDRERQFEMLNRVQDNYVYFINNINRLFISGGAGTGKTFIALKLLRKFEKNGNVLYLCYGKRLKHFIKDQFPNSNVELISLENEILPKSIKYDFIVVDEAQDLDFEQARSILNLLRDSSSHLYVFYDKSQNVFNKEFKNGFDIELPPFLLRENLRNTSSIYKFAVERTELGKDVIANPIVGPEPETILLKKQNYKEKLEDLINYLVFDEFVFHKDICIIAESTVYSELLSNTFFKWNLKSTINPNDNEIKLFTVSDYKGLESNVIIYIRSSSLSKIGDYIAYTRARYYLYEILID